MHATGAKTLARKISKALSKNPRVALGIKGGFVAGARQQDQVEWRLKVKAAALRQAAAIAQLGGWNIDVASSQVFWSDELCSILGWPLGSRPNLQEALAVYAPTDRLRIAKLVEHAIQTGERIETEAQASRRDTGAPLWLRISAEAELVDGQCVALRGAAQEITRLKAGDQRLLEANSLAAGVLESLRARVCVLDRGGSIVALNAASLEMAEATGLVTRKNVIGMNYFSLFRTIGVRQSSKLTAGIKFVLGGSRKYYERDYLMKMHGKRTWWKMSVTRAESAGPLRVVITHQDITQLKADETLLRRANKSLERARNAANAANAAKSAFLANMSHEIRTPLNGVIAVADMLAQAELGPREYEMVQIIRRSGETLDRLLSDILDLAGVEAGAISLEKRPFHLAEVVRRAAAPAVLHAREKGLELTVAISDDAEGQVLGDRIRVTQIITNILGNAVKFTEAGKVDLSVGKTAYGFTFTVRDTGVGFDPAQTERLFGRFQQADETSTRRFGGLGLGLAVSRELAIRMGGSLTCDSTPGEGSVFTLTLPLTVLTEPGAIAEGRVEAPSKPVHGAKLRVLVADDHPVNRKVAGLVLESCGAEIVYAATGVEAVAACEVQHFDVVLMDMQMPEMDGLTATRAIRRLAGAIGGVPIVMLTANVMPEHVAAAYAAGANLHLAKPVSAAALAFVIQQMAAHENSPVKRGRALAA